MNAGDRVSPWLDANCRRCDHAGRCELERRLLEALKTWTALPKAVADRMGVPHDGLFGAWTCREFVLASRPQSSSPAGPEGSEA